MTDRILLVMRHAKSSWKTHDVDLKRPLNGRGKRDAFAAGALIAGYAPDLVWCSPAERTRQTWERAERGGARCPDVRIVDQLYAASGAELLQVVRSTPSAVRTVLLIAHEPGVSELITTVAISSPLTAAVAEGFPTACIAALHHRLDWDELGPGLATLESLERPRDRPDQYR